MSETVVIKDNLNLLINRQFLNMKGYMNSKLIEQEKNHFYELTAIIKSIGSVK